VGVRSWELLAVWQDCFDFVWWVYFAVVFFINAAPPGRIFLTAKDTKYTKGWMIKLPPRFRILFLRMTFQPIRRSIFPKKREA